MTCHKPHSKGTGHVAQWVSICLGPMTPWVLFLAPNKLDFTGVALPSGDFPSSSGLLSSIHYAKCMDRRLHLRGQTVFIYWHRPSVSTGSGQIHKLRQCDQLLLIRLIGLINIDDQPVWEGLARSIVKLRRLTQSVDVTVPGAGVPDSISELSLYYPPQPPHTDAT